MATPILRIAVPSPLRRAFDYLAPPAQPGPWPPGIRVRVPFGRRTVVGVLLESLAHSDLPPEKLRPAVEVIDEEPLIAADLLSLLSWAADYYQYPLGEVLAAALPVRLRNGLPAETKGPRRWLLTEAGRAVDSRELARAPRQMALIELLRRQGEAAAEMLDREQPGWPPIMRRLVEKGWVTSREEGCLPPVPAHPLPAPRLNGDQQRAVGAVCAAEGFAAFLLDGVTGSGKTEVYLGIIERVVAAGRQALVLAPEIGLTPQLVARFRERFAVPVAVLHSGLSDGERLCAWTLAGRGKASIIIGTRSAIFTPLARPGVFIVDEEHDTSYKQQEGFRYSARDLAVLRAREAGVPVVLGSATPSLESLHNVSGGRYRRLSLPERAGAAGHPAARLLDLRRQPLDEGLSPPLLAAMAEHLSAGGQVLLFLNRRGFAPTLLCHDCGWVARCLRCDAHLTLHQGQGRLRCHHCGSERRIAVQCPDCGSPDLRAIGQGTERVEGALERHFPGAGIVRIDRDSTRRKGAMEALLDRARAGEGRILIGTQMLAKGHHLPDVTLVGILDADQGLFSVDFRAPERMAQLIVQVMGRAGRAERPGEVLIQTHHPDHPLLLQLVQRGYHDFATAALAERQAAALPPFSHLALLRAEGTDPEAPKAFLEAARSAAIPRPGLYLLGPVPAPMERRAGRHRAQLLLQAPTRSDLHAGLKGWVERLEGLKEARRVRWSLDVDPVDMF